MSWRFFITAKESNLHEHRAELLLRNVHVFLLSTFLAYLMCALKLPGVLSATQNIVMFASLCLYFIYVLVLVHDEKKFLEKSLQKFGQWTTFSVLFFWIIWWNIYFHYLSIGISEAELVQLILALIIMVVAFSGWFGQMSLGLVLLTVIHIVTVIWFRGNGEFGRLFWPGVMLIAFLVVFFYTFQKQSTIPLEVQIQNKHLLSTLKEANDALERANLSQSRYLSAASHDLRQPLHALALLTSDAIRKNTTPENTQTLSKIDQAIDSLSQSFNAVLNLSRLDAGVVKPEYTEVSLQRVFDRLSVEFEEVAHQKRIDLNISPTKIWVLTDEGMLHSILSNFISNALRYTEIGKVLVGVRSDKNGMVRVLVYDTGVGVPQEKACQIFEEYQRLEYAEQRVKGGVGLGLAISERMARLLGAELLVKSVLGKGSCFGLKVPRVIPALESVHSITERELLSNPLQGKRVAILEDDEVAIDYLYTLLTSWGLDVTVVTSKDMLRECFVQGGDFDLILSDYHLNLDNETGLDALMLAQTLQPHCPPKCVLVTGDTSAELMQATHAVNADILYKPIRPVRLRAFLNALFTHQ